MYTKHCMAEGFHKENARIAKNTLIIYVRMVFVILIGIVSARFVLQALGASDFGLYKVVGGLIAMLGFLSTAMSTTTRRFINIEMGKPDGDPNRIFNILMVVHIALAGVILLFAETFGLWYIHHVLNVESGKIPDAVFVFQVSTLVACMGIINLPFQSLIESFEKFILSSLIDIGTNLVKLALVIVLLYWPGNALRFYALCMSVVTFLSLLLYHGCCRRMWPSIIRWNPQRGKENYKEILWFNNWTALSALAYIGRTQGSNLIVNWFFGTFVNGALAVAYELENFSVMSINRISSAAAPQITQNYGGGNHNRSLDLVYKISRYSALLMTVLVFCAWVELDFVLDLWLKDVPDGALLFCQWTMASALVRSFTGGTQTLEQATGRIKWFQIVNSAMSLACLPLGWLAFRLGAEPVTIIQIYIAYSVLYRLVEFWLLHRLLDFKVGSFVRKAYLRPLVVVSLMGLYFAAYRALVPAGMVPAGRLAGIALTFVVSCLLVFCVGLFPWERQSVMSAVRSKFRK